MVVALHMLNLVLAALVLTSALAHVLEFPGKLRLDKEGYLATQQIYYPGFTIAGAAEPLAIMVLGLQLLAGVTPDNTFWLLVLALASFIVAHGIYWLVTHPVNKFWVKDIELKGAGKRFFHAGVGSSNPEETDWTALRDRWEWSHVARAVFAAAAFLLIAAAVSLA